MLEGVYGAEYCIIGMIHLVLGVQIARRLRKYFPQFHAKYKLYLNLITICLSLPAFLRGIIDFLDSFSWPFDEWFYVTCAGWTSPLFFLICDYIPLTSNLGALIFGVIRYKDDKIVSVNEDEVIPTLG